MGSLKEFAKIPGPPVHLDHANIFNGFCGPGIFDGLGNA